MYGTGTGAQIKILGQFKKHVRAALTTAKKGQHCSTVIYLRKLVKINVNVTERYEKFKAEDKEYLLLN